jgi:hypothetical protein
VEKELKTVEFPPGLLAEVLKAVDEGKTIRLVKTWTGTHILGSRWYDNENILIEVDDETLFDQDFQSDVIDLDDLDWKFNDFINAVYEKAYDKALELLLNKLNLTKETLEEKGDIHADEEGNILYFADDVRYAVVFTEYHRFDSAGKHITTYIYFKPQLMPME